MSAAPRIPGRVADTCWASALTRDERRELAARLARARSGFYRARLHWLGTDPHMLVQSVRASIDMSGLLLDVTGPLEVPSHA